MSDVTMKCGVGTMVCGDLCGVRCDIGNGYWVGNYGHRGIIWDNSGIAVQSFHGTDYIGGTLMETAIPQDDSMNIASIQDLQHSIFFGVSGNGDFIGPYASASQVHQDYDPLTLSWGNDCGSVAMAINYAQRKTWPSGQDEEEVLDVHERRAKIGRLTGTFMQIGFQTYKFFADGSRNREWEVEFPRECTRGQIRELAGVDETCRISLLKEKE